MLKNHFLDLDFLDFLDFLRRVCLYFFLPPTNEGI